VNMETIMPYLLAAAWAVASAGVAWYIGQQSRQITYVTLADGRQQARTIPMLFRLLLPLAPNLRPLFRKPSFTKPRQQFDQRITMAGYEGLITGEEILALRILLPLVAGPLWIGLVRLLVATAKIAALYKLEHLLYLMGVVFLLTYPSRWLSSSIKSRHKSIQRALPFVLDLLTLSVEAGLDFMSAMQRNIQRRAIDPLGEELIRVTREIQLGKTRRQALRDMSARVNLTDLRSVVNALVQADELGVGIGAILRIQSDQMRQRRFEHAEKLANEAPVKMLFPLMIFIFPAVFLILMGPVILRFMQQGGF
jgi:tight adherence protein C